MITPLGSNIGSDSLGSGGQRMSRNSFGRKNTNTMGKRYASIDLTNITSGYDPIQLPQEMNNILAGKADKRDLMNMLDIKSNKVDTEATMHALEVIHKQISTVVVLCVEMLKTFVNN